MSSRRCSNAEHPLRSGLWHPLRLVDALGRDLPSFFGANPDQPGVVLRARQRPIVTTAPIRDGRGIHYERLVPFGAGNLLEGNIHVVEPGGVKHDPITHQGETVGYVIEGTLELTIEGTLYLLHTGDSFFFKNHLTNSYSNPGAGETAKRGCCGSTRRRCIEGWR